MIMAEIITTISSFVGLLIAFFVLFKRLETKTKAMVHERITKMEVNSNQNYHKLEKQIEKLGKKMAVNELDRLISKLAHFTNRLRGGEKPSISHFKVFYKDFEKYEKLGGNSFIRQEKEFVDNCYKQIHGKSG